MKRNIIIIVRKELSRYIYSYHNINKDLSELGAIDKDIEMVKCDIDKLNKVNSLLVERRKDLKELEELRKLVVENAEAKK